MGTTISGAGAHGAVADTDRVPVSKAGVKGYHALSSIATYVRTALGLREVLTAARTYYVRTDGSDSNTGFADTAGGAFLTIQKAIDVAAALDSSIYDVTIQLAAGTYSTATGNVCKNMAGAGSITIVGDETTPANVIVTTSGAMTTTNGIFLARALGTTYKLRGVKLTSSSSGTVFGLFAAGGSNVEFQNCDFGAGTTQQLRAEDGAVVTATGNYSITGSALQHIGIADGTLRIQSRTVTLSGTPGFATAFMASATGGAAFMNSNTFSGSATGPRYLAEMNGVIRVNGAGATYLPGDSAGSAVTGGQYA